MNICSCYMADEEIDDIDYGDDGDDGDDVDVDVDADDDDDLFEGDGEGEGDKDDDDDNESEPEPELEKDKENPCDNVHYDEAQSATEDGFKTVNNNTVHTLRYLTKYEIARILGVRAQQLIAGAPSMIKHEGSMSEFEIAKMELKQHKLPMIIGRPMPNGDMVMIRVCDLIVKI